jgi:hypothetical protein
MPKKTSQIVKETTTGVSDDTDDDIYLEEPTEVVELRPRPSQRTASPSMRRSASPSMRSASPSTMRSRSRSRGPKKRTAAIIEKEYNDANALQEDRKYDLTPLGDRNNRRSGPSHSSIDPWEVARAKEIARAEKEEEAAEGDDKEG